MSDRRVVEESHLVECALGGYWYICIYTYIHAYVHMFVYIYIHMCIHMYVYILATGRVLLRNFISRHVLYVGLHTFVCIHVHIYKYTYTYGRRAICCWGISSWRTCCRWILTYDIYLMMSMRVYIMYIWCTCIRMRMRNVLQVDIDICVYI